MIELVTTWDALVNAFGAGAMIAFGVWVLTLTPRTRATKLLAVFAIAAGAVYVPQNLIAFTGWHEIWIYGPLWGGGLLIAGLALLALIREMLDPLEGRARRLWHLALAVTVLLPVVSLLPLVVDGPPPGVRFGDALSFIFQQLGILLFFTAFLALALVLARRYRHPPDDREEATRTQAVLVTAALVLWPTFEAGRNVSFVARPPFFLSAFTLSNVLLFAGFLAVAGLWLVNTRAVPERSREARNVALLTLAMLLAGILQGVFVRPRFPVKTGGPFWGVVRLVTVVALGYAILRHQVLGIDAKFRWGVSKTTVAGIFVAVFFVVSEGAQVLFTGFAGSELLGIVAAGALLFALAPVQRLADRVAERVVPEAEGVSVDSDERRRAYKDALRVALRDRELSREEEAKLARLADHLGIGAAEAVDLLAQVEDEAEGGDAP